MTGMLASVESVAEALLVMEAGVDIIDLKSPSTGSLGALPLATVREIVQAVGGLLPVSATIGDLPMDPARVFQTVESMACTGVDYVKIGLFPEGDWRATVFGLSPLAACGDVVELSRHTGGDRRYPVDKDVTPQIIPSVSVPAIPAGMTSKSLDSTVLAHRVRLVAVLFGDLSPGLAQIAELAEAGFSAVMLDTLDKRGGSLTQVCGLGYLRDFVAEAKAYGMLCGLAGSLRQTDIPLLLTLRADYLGFRGALCRRQNRTAGLDGSAVHAIRSMLHY